MRFNKKQEIDANNIPGHIAIIMDGNGRWAKKEVFPEVWVIEKAPGPLKKLWRNAIN